MELVLSQLKATEYVAAIAVALEGMDPRAERARLLKEISARFTDYQSELMAWLEPGPGPIPADEEVD